MHLERGIGLKKKIDYFKITPKNKDKYSNGFHVWDNGWPHEIFIDINPKDVDIIKDAQKKYEGLYYQELV